MSEKIKNSYKIKSLLFKVFLTFLFILFITISFISFKVVNDCIKDTEKITKESMYKNWFTENTFELKDAPIYLKYAVVSIEDERFYKHNGVDFMGLTRSVATNLIKGTKHGGSTIDMQVSKNMLTTSDQTVNRKIKDMYYAIEMNKVLTKDQILEIYLNNMYLARGPYGIKDAAEKYFGKDVQYLTLSECATLVGITKNPAKYSTDLEALKERRDIVLFKMKELNYITEKEYIDAKNTELLILPNE